MCFLHVVVTQESGFNESGNDYWSDDFIEKLSKSVQRDQNKAQIWKKNNEEEDKDSNKKEEKSENSQEKCVV